MKKIGFYFFTSCLIVLGACSNDDPVTVRIDKTANLQSTGDSANDILSNDNFDKLLIEIDYVEGFRPSEEAMTNFVTYLKERTFKQDIEILYEEVQSPNEESLSLDKIAELEGKNRNHYNDGSTLAIHIYFTDSPSEDDDEDEGLVTLGAVYRNTSMIIHEVTVRKLAGQSPLISNADIETATLNHEFGHLFGLVDLGTPQVNQHEDDDAVNHCNVEGCLMRAELQFGGPSGKSQLTSSKNIGVGGLKAGCSLSGYSVMQMLKNKTAKGLAPAVPLDAECIRDLQANGGR